MLNLEYNYQFPLNNRAVKLSVYQQINKCCEEMSEVVTEVVKPPYNAAKNDKWVIDIAEVLQGSQADYDASKLLEETFDLIHAAEGVLKKFSTEQVQEAYNKVIQKNKERNDYTFVS